MSASLPNAIPRDLAARAIPLDSLGLMEFAWTREDAERTISALEGSGVAILGGDVYHAMLDGIKITYDNWTCNRNDSESNSDYVARSHDASRNFIDTYPTAGVGHFIFVLVFKE